MPRFQILALDGGGIRGLFSAAVLAKLEDDCNTRVADHFDLIAGTSTGGIIALGIGAGLSPRQIVEFYLDCGRSVFRSTPIWSGLKHLFVRKYGSVALEKALRNCFGEKRLADSTKRLLIPSYNMGVDGVHLFKTPHHKRLTRDFRIPLWQVAMATSAAPTYFPAFRGVDRSRLVDGGLWANNPTVVAIAEAVSMLDCGLESLSILSLGTTKAVVRNRNHLDWSGKLLWARSAVDLILRSQSLAANNHAIHLLGRNRVVRLDPDVPDGLFGLDKLSLDDLLAHAAHESRAFAPVFCEKFQSHRAEEFEPLYK